MCLIQGNYAQRYVRYAARRTIKLINCLMPIERELGISKTERKPSKELAERLAHELRDELKRENMSQPDFADVYYPEMIDVKMLKNMISRSIKNDLKNCSICLTVDHQRESRAITAIFSSAIVRW